MKNSTERRTAPSAQDIERMNDALANLRHMYPAYDDTEKLDMLRSAEFARLDKANHAYLDYTGGGLYSDSQITEHLSLLRSNIFGNPHSDNPSSLASTEAVGRARQYVLKYFNASPDEYEVIFTQNASGALKLVGESYPFGPESRCLLTFDNHNAVNGLREFAGTKNASVTYIPVIAPELRIDTQHLQEQLEEPNPRGHNLFVYPAQSNFSGVLHSLDWIESAQKHAWDVVLDAAAFVPTHRLDLRVHHPDFVTLSFYKMFGYPTGVGCLIAKKVGLTKLRRPWFSGGTIEVASVQGDRFHFAEGGRAFEDGTIDYLMIPAIEIGLKFLENADIDTIHDRVVMLTGWLLRNLESLLHTNGTRVVEIYGPETMEDRAGTIALNFHDPDDAIFNFHHVEQEASQANISLRTGCFCNPGAGEVAFGLSGNDMKDCFGYEEKTSFERCIIAMKGKTAGAVRVSFGLATNFSDVYRFLQFARSFVNKAAS